MRRGRIRQNLWLCLCGMRLTSAACWRWNCSRFRCSELGISRAPYLVHYLLYLERQILQFPVSFDLKNDWIARLEDAINYSKLCY